VQLARSALNPTSSRYNPTLPWSSTEVVYTNPVPAVSGDEVAPALFGHAHKTFLASLDIDIREGRLVILEGAHLLQLLLDAAAALQGKVQ